jgi:hypothetical protein
MAGSLHALAGARHAFSPLPTRGMQMSSRNALAGRGAVSPRAKTADPAITDIVERAILMRIATPVVLLGKQTQAVDCVHVENL